MVDAESMPSADTPETVCFAKELWREIENLPKAQRDVLALTISGYKLREISEMRGGTTQRASYLLCAARKRLAAQINKKG